MRRTFAKLAHRGLAPVEQIQLSLGHASLHTTERYLGLEQDLADAPGNLRGWSPFRQCLMKTSGEPRFLLGLGVREEPESASQPNGEAFNQPMFRAMKQDPEGFPLIGRSGRTLGVRVDGAKQDIPVAEDGTVSPNTGGMSVALDRATNLPNHRLPRLLGGDGRDPVFRMYGEVLPKALLLRPGNYPHACVEPSGRCPLPEFESALAGTRTDWRKAHD